MSPARNPKPGSLPSKTVALKMDLNDLTIGDLEDFEDATGVALNDAMRPRKLRDGDGDLILTTDEHGNEKPQWVVEQSPSTLRALVWIALRKTRPGFTYDDARDIRVADLNLTPRKTAPAAKKTPAARTKPAAPRSSATSTT